MLSLLKSNISSKLFPYLLQNCFEIPHLDEKTTVNLNTLQEHYSTEMLYYLIFFLIANGFISFKE